MLDVCELEETSQSPGSNEETARELGLMLPSADGRGAGVVGALRRLAVETARWTQATCDVVVVGEIGPISALSALGLYRVAEQWLRLSAGERGAIHLSISLLCRNGVLELSVRDDAVRQNEQPANTEALANLEGLARSVGGGIAVSTRRGGGTKMTFWVPCGTSDDLVNFHAA